MTTKNHRTVIPTARGPVELRLGEPVLLSTNVSVDVGKTAIPDVRPLQNLYRNPCAIEQVRFIVRGLDHLAETTEPFWQGPGGVVRAKIAMGRMPLTAGHMPIWLFGPEVQELAEVAETGTYITDGGIHTPFGTIYPGETFACYTTYRWRFAHPLIVPPGAALNTELFVYNDPLIGLSGYGPEVNQTLRVDIAYAGRILMDAKIPDAPPIPYATSANFDQRPDGSVVRLSAEDELKNPFQVPFHLHRLVARCQDQNGSSGIYDNYSLHGLTDPGGADIVRLVKLRDSTGYALTPQAVPLNHLSDPFRRAWTFAGSLDPKERLQVELLFDPDRRNKPMFGLVGWRNERISP